MRESLKEYCSRCGRQELIDQWHPEKNAALTPADISYGSQRKVWWRCGQGHEWQSPPYARTGRGSGCPICAGKRPAPGEDLQSRHPALAVQWHPLRNGTLTPDQVAPDSHRRVWWQCGQGHEWNAMIRTRTAGGGCPVCDGRVVIPGKNDLQSCAPALAAQWHPEKNGALQPHQVGSGSSRKVWWQCDRGHTWQAAVSVRAAGSGCPVCAGRIVVTGENDLRSRFPELAAQWHPAKNGSLTPERISGRSTRRVWWRCRRGHAWQCAVSARTERGKECPYCSGQKVLAGFNDLETAEPLLAAQWHPARNAPLEPSMVMPGSTRRVWWRCNRGHEWKAAVCARTAGSGCPVCAGRR